MPDPARSIRARPVPIQCRVRRVRVARADLRSLVRAALDHEGAPDGAGLGVVLAGDRLLRRVNHDFRGKDRTTDVLSFPHAEPSRGIRPRVRRLAQRAGRDRDLMQEAEASLASLDEQRLLGEVLISLPRCFAQAAERGVAPGVELVRLVVHGLLHVLGHDHEKPRDAARMQPRERTLRRWAAARGIGPRLLRAPSR